MVVHSREFLVKIYSRGNLHRVALLDTTKKILEILQSVLSFDTLGGLCYELQRMIVFLSSGVLLQKARTTNFANTPLITPEGLSDIYGRGFVVYALESGCHSSSGVRNACFTL